MALTIPSLDDRRYQQLLDEALARIPVHTPEYTNFNKSDPGVTIVEVFAFLVESLLYRSNLIPERNRIKFLNLLGIPLAPAQEARGLVTLVNERGPLQTITLNDDLEVRAGPAPFRTTLALDVLPIEAQVYTKQRRPDVAPTVQQYYRELYASYIGSQPVNTTDALIYESVPFPLPGSGAAASASQGVALSDTVDRCIWVALLLRAGDAPATEEQKRLARAAIANRVLNLGLLPVVTEAGGRRLGPVAEAAPQTGSLLSYQLPDLPPGGLLPKIASQRVPQYKALPALASGDVLAEPGIVQLRLPSAGELALWSNVDPLEMGVGDFPPSLEDAAVADRLLTWLRISAPASLDARFLWVGVNATFVTQRTHIANELLPVGTGEPDQTVTLSQPPVIPGSVQLTVTPPGDKPQTWQPVDDLYVAGPEIPVRDPRLPPGAAQPAPAPSRVYTLDPTSGVIRFGDGAHGSRPPFGATLRASYDRGLGEQGNVGAGAINSAAALPAGMKVNNPVPTWGGAAAETAREGEKQITRYLQHRDRLVSASDFATIVRRTPGVDVGRVEVLPAYTPELGPNTPGDAPGAVTLVLIPGRDPAHPDAPEPDRLFLDAVCSYLNPRRLVTTEVFLRGPNYRTIWVAVGITVGSSGGQSSVSIAQVTEGVKLAVQQFLSPLPPAGARRDDTPVLFLPPAAAVDAGWPLRKSVLRLELMAVANRVPGVLLVNGVRLLDDRGVEQESIALSGLDLPKLGGIAVAIGDAPPASAIPSFGSITGPSTGAGAPSAFVPVPFIPEECR